MPNPKEEEEEEASVVEDIAVALVVGDMAPEVVDMVAKAAAEDMEDTRVVVVAGMVSKAVGMVVLRAATSSREAPDAADTADTVVAEAEKVATERRR